MKIEYHKIPALSASKNLLSMPEKTFIENKITGLVYYVLLNKNNRVKLLSLNEYDFGGVVTYTKEEAEEATAFEISDKELRIRNS